MGGMDGGGGFDMSLDACDGWMWAGKGGRGCGWSDMTLGACGGWIWAGREAGGVGGLT